MFDRAVASVTEFLTSPPLWALVAAGGIAVVLLAIITARVIARIRFHRRVDRFLDTPGRKRAGELFSDDELLRRSRLLERKARREERDVVEVFELDRLWSERLVREERRADFRRVLRYGLSRGLFACFLVALRNRRYAASLRSYLNEHPDPHVLRRLAGSGRGEPFDGGRALALFSDRVDEIREMTGDPEWPSRYFAVNVLVHDSEERSDRAVRDAFTDPHPLIRKTAASGYHTSDRGRLYELMLDLLMHDPVYEVRAVARERIRGDLNDLYTLDAQTLSPDDALHVVGLLDPNHPDDVNAALDLLAGNNLELRLAAARFLTTSGTLHRLFMNVSFSDRTEMARVRALLQRAISVHVVEFLTGITENPRPATLLVAAFLLCRHGPKEFIVETADRVFQLPEETPSFREIYTATVRAIRDRGSEEAQRLLVQEILRRRDHPELLPIALAGVPSGHDPVYRDTLIDALCDETFPARESVRRAFLKLETSVVLAVCYDIITGRRDQFSHTVRIDALLALGALKLPFTLQDILEHLPILPVDVARDFTRTLDEFHPRELERKVRSLLHGVDGSVRAALIAALPATGKKTFLQEIIAALNDADPDVRIAAAWALADYGETEAIEQAASMLRDPVERVRRSVARALAVGGGIRALEALRDSLADEHETEAVKLAVVEGLGDSPSVDATDMLVDALRVEGPLQREAEIELAGRTDPASVRRLVEQFKEADPTLRDRITRVFTIMGESAEAPVRQVLDEEIPSLRPHLAAILEQTGYVESRIRLLRHRDPELRRDAAGVLAKVGSEAAFRGIVIAARDPDPAVRAQVAGALRKLVSSDGQDILQALQNDPDRKIRRHTNWATERVKSQQK